MSRTLDLGYLNLYVYSQLKLTANLTAIFGGSADRLEGRAFDEEQFSPKLGLIWQPSANTTIRAAVFEALQKPFLSRQAVQPSLEPTQVAGFNQFLFASEGEKTSQLGVGVDHRVSSEIYIGAEISKRDLIIPFTTVDPISMELVEERVDVDEQLGSLYVAWMPTNSLSLSVKYQHEYVDNAGQVFAEGFSELKTQKIPLELNYFHGRYLSAGLTATYLRQSGIFPADLEDPMGDMRSDGDNAWVLDGSFQIRFPGRRGVVSLRINNLLDEEFQFQDTDPENPHIYPERFVSTRVTFSF
jgi:outer membrane receptor protein involved in Fe transport